MLEIDILNSIRFNKRKFLPTVNIAWFGNPDHPQYGNSDGVDLYRGTDELTPENIAVTLRNLQLDTILEAARLNKQMRNRVKSWKIPPLFDLTKLEGEIFIKIPDYKTFRTEREDGKKDFFPRVSLNALHLLL